MSNSPNSYLDGIAQYKIFSDEKETGAGDGLLSFKIRKEINKISKTQFIFSAGDMPKGEIPELEKGDFALGKTIKIHAGYGNDLKPIFTGMVVSYKYEIDTEKESKLVVECRDWAFLMTKEKKTSIFTGKTDEDIIKEIFNYENYKSKIKLNFDGKTSGKPVELQQFEATDWDFVLARADANGLIIISDGENVRIEKINTEKKGDFVLQQGVDIIEYGGKASLVDMYKEVFAIAWNPKEQKTIQKTSPIPKLGGQKKPENSNLGQFVVRSSAAVDENMLKAFADAQAARIATSFITGPCKFCGNNKVQIGTTIELKNVSNFNGHVYIGALEHECDEKGWTSSIQMGLPFGNRLVKEDNSLALPFTGGLYIGKVSQLEEDAEKEVRIQVEIPLADKKDNKIWARLGNFWASAGYGSFFIPEVGDEVILGFFNNDPSYPVILGSLYSSKQKPPYEIKKENNRQAIVTKSKIKLEFDDKDKSITLETPGKNTVIISDKDKSITLKDQNSNKIVMDASGITVESAKDLTLKAKMNIKLEAGANLDAQAKANLTLKGLKVEASANTELAMKGTAKAELSAAGQTVVKGAMVMIN